MLHFAPVKKLSTHMMFPPSASNRSQRCEPRKPAPRSPIRAFQDACARNPFELRCVGSPITAFTCHNGRQVPTSKSEVEAKRSLNQSRRKIEAIRNGLQGLAVGDA